MHEQLSMKSLGPGACVQVIDAHRDELRSTLGSDPGRKHKADGTPIRRAVVVVVRGNLVLKLDAAD